MSSTCRRISIAACFSALVFAGVPTHAQQSSPDTSQIEQQEREAKQRADAEKAVKALPECSLSKTNADCRLTIDRQNAIMPTTVQMYSNTALTVIVRNPKEYERYFLDYQSGQATLSPDVTSAIVQGLLPQLAKFNDYSKEVFLLPAGQPLPPDPCAAKELTSDPLPIAKHVKDVLKPFQTCLGKLASDAIKIYREMEPSIAPDSRTPNGLAPDDADLDATQGDISGFLAAEIAVSSRITNIAGIDKIKDTDG